MSNCPIVHCPMDRVKKGCWKDQKVDIKLRNLDLFLEDFGTLTELGRSLGSSWFTLTKMLDNDKKKETPTFRPDKRPPPGPPRKKIGRINPGGQNTGMGMIDGVFSIFIDEKYISDKNNLAVLDCFQIGGNLPVSFTTYM
ncbi:uncharacterized protein TRIADDRAFT_64041 [Trichoplax adhaerens]|uniref:Uncharacterized protein n=1 Tax=Trichoplax adhaerens TaxID=10228 RepID=B3S080_TRIAD|nr:predicted protein [Trichoplax adhaerens]EDV24342.1 predicted protein [Trichoplax adhaerens]|eukprot:XP_002113868.1 predicted protein [Trichoplax adhaerens]